MPAATVPPPLTTEVVREIRTRPAPSGSPNVSPLPKLSSFATPFLTESSRISTPALVATTFSS